MTTTSKRLREEAARWFARMQNAAPDHPDRGRFEAWLMSSPAHASEYAAFAETWDDFDSISRLQSLAQALELKKAELGDKYVKTVVRGVLGIFLAITCSLLGYQVWMAQPVYTLASSTSIGEIKRQQLADGTLLTLNADTSAEIIYYRNKRTAVLKRGEVIFDVAGEPERPFIIDSGHARITVLGTHFAVNRLNRLVRVSVDHGRVRVEAQDAEGNTMHEPLVLSGGEVAEVDAGKTPARVQRNAQDAFSFQSGSVTFQQATMDEIAETLSRYRKKPIVAVEGNGQHVTAIVQVVDIESFLQVLPKIAPVRVSETANNTQILRR
ncbi:Protein FecR [Methylophilaceae bacterium]|nr:Protein FecR [Methylophilaceae bacterium]